jgi:hypothetical protein
MLAHRESVVWFIGTATFGTVLAIIKSAGVVEFAAMMLVVVFVALVSMWVAYRRFGPHGNR